MIVPSILALAYLGLSIYHEFKLLPDLNLLPLVIWLVAAGDANYIADGSIQITIWGLIAASISYAISMVINALVTGLIVYRIFKVLQKVHSTSTEKSLGVNGGRNYRSLIFVIIESGFALFAIQLVRIILYFLLIYWNATPISDALNFIIVIHQIFNVIIILVIFIFILLITVDLARV